MLTQLLETFPSFFSPCFFSTGLPIICAFLWQQEQREQPPDGSGAATDAKLVLRARGRVWRRSWGGRLLREGRRDLFSLGWFDDRWPFRSFTHGHSLILFFFFQMNINSQMIVTLHSFKFAEQRDYYSPPDGQRSFISLTSTCEFLLYWMLGVFNFALCARRYYHVILILRSNLSQHNV